VTLTQLPWSHNRSSAFILLDLISFWLGPLSYCLWFFPTFCECRGCEEQCVGKKLGEQWRELLNYLFTGLVVPWQCTMQKNTLGWDMAVFGSVWARLSKRRRPTFLPNQDAKLVDWRQNLTRRMFTHLYSCNLYLKNQNLKSNII